MRRFGVGGQAHAVGLAAATAAARFTCIADVLKAVLAHAVRESVACRCHVVPKADRALGDAGRADVRGVAPARTLQAPELRSLAAVVEPDGTRTLAWRHARRHRVVSLSTHDTLALPDPILVPIGRARLASCSAVAARADTRGASLCLGLAARAAVRARGAAVPGRGLRGVQRAWKAAVPTARVARVLALPAHVSAAHVPCRVLYAARNDGALPAARTRGGARHL